MAQTVSVIVSAEDRAQLAAIIGDRNRPLKHVQRAKIVLHSADRLPALEVARRSAISRPAVWRWQRHYAEGGIERLLREGSRKPGKPPVPLSTVAKVVALTVLNGTIRNFVRRLGMTGAKELDDATTQRTSYP